MEGYDFIVVSKEVEEYRCPICMMLLRDALSLPCSHAACKRCLHKWQQQKTPGALKCPSCNTAYHKKNVHNLPIVDRIITTSLDVRCKQYANEHGCQWIGKICDYKDHEWSCGYVLQQCRFTGCREEIPQNKVEEHELDCQYRTIRCSFCLDEIMFYEENSHLGECKLHPVCCPKEECTELMLSDHVPQHIMNDCQYVDIICPFHSVGCTSLLKRIDKEEHLEISLQSHSELILQHTLKTSNELLEIKKSSVSNQKLKSRDKDIRKQITKMLNDNIQELNSKNNQVEVFLTDKMENLEAKQTETDETVTAILNAIRQNIKKTQGSITVEEFNQHLTDVEIKCDDLQTRCNTIRGELEEIEKKNVKEISRLECSIFGLQRSRSVEEAIEMFDQFKRLQNYQLQWLKKKIEEQQEDCVHWSRSLRKRMDEYGEKFNYLKEFEEQQAKCVNLRSRRLEQRMDKYDENFNYLKKIEEQQADCVHWSRSLEQRMDKYGEKFNYLKKIEEQQADCVHWSRRLEQRMDKYGEKCKYLLGICLSVCFCLIIIVIITVAEKLQY